MSGFSTMDTTPPLTKTNTMGVLFHATWGCLTDKINAQGLLPGHFQTWKGCVSGCVYLADDTELAAAFCEAADDVSDEVYGSGIVVFSVDRSILDETRLVADPNIIDATQKHCFAYFGEIPTAALAITKTVKT